MRVDCPAQVETLPDGALACVDGLGGAVAWTVQEDWSGADIDTAQAGQAFGAAFALAFFFWAFGKGIGVVLHAVRAGRSG